MSSKKVESIFNFIFKNYVPYDGVSTREINFIFIVNILAIKTLFMFFESKIVQLLSTVGIAVFIQLFVHGDCCFAISDILSQLDF